MDIDRYADEARKHATELYEEFLPAAEAARAACGRLGRRKVAALLAENETALLDYVRATPSARKGLLRRIDPRLRPLFLMGALHRARCGWALLQTVCRRGVTAGPGYRMVTAQAAAAALDLQREWPTLWPLDDDDPLGES